MTQIHSHSCAFTLQTFVCVSTTVFNTYERLKKLPTLVINWGGADLSGLGGKQAAQQQRTMPSSSSANEFIALKRQTLWSQVRGWAPQTLTLLGAGFHSTATKATKNQLCHKKYQEIRKGNMYTHTHTCMHDTFVCVRSATGQSCLSDCLSVWSLLKVWVSECVCVCPCVGANKRATTT